MGRVKSLEKGIESGRGRLWKQEATKYKRTTRDRCLGVEGWGRRAGFTCLWGQWP